MEKLGEAEKTGCAGSYRPPRLSALEEAMVSSTLLLLSLWENGGTGPGWERTWREEKKGGVVEGEEEAHKFSSHVALLPLPLLPASFSSTPVAVLGQGYIILMLPL